MSEYQYYEWQTVDRTLTPEERVAVDRLSSHIEVSSSQAVVTYNWGNFKHDPRDVLLNYFDAHFYMANWGSLRLMFRFPRGLINEDDLQPYCVDENITFETTAEYLVLDLEFNPEDGGDWEEYQADLSDFIRLRADLLDGDHRLLYLAWLKAMTFYGNPEYDPEEEEDDDFSYSPINDREPPVPPGLKRLSPALQSFVNVFDIDPFLVQAAAEASPDAAKALGVDYASLVGRLSRPECDTFLIRMAEGEAGVALALRKRLATFLPQTQHAQPAEPRTLNELLLRAEELKMSETKRQAEAARMKYITGMKNLANQEEQTWKKVEEMLDNGRKIAAVYDDATALLEKLQQLSKFQDTRDIFQQRIHRLAEKYSARSALIGRWHSKGWV